MLLTDRVGRTMFFPAYSGPEYLPISWRDLSRTEFFGVIVHPGEKVFEFWFDFKNA